MQSAPVYLSKSYTAPCETGRCDCVRQQRDGDPMASQILLGEGG